MQRNARASAPYLYYRKRSSKPTYGTVPTGRLNVPRLIAGLSAWRQSSDSTETKKKTIVLADWTVRFLNDPQKIHVKNVIKELLDNGFEILYFDENGKSQTLKKENFDEDNIEKYFPFHPENSKEIESRVIKQKKLAKDSIFVLNDHWMHVLCSKKPHDTRQPRTLDVNAYQTYSRPDTQERFFDYFKKEKPVYSHFSGKYIDFHVKWKLKTDFDFKDLDDVKEFELHTATTEIYYINKKRFLENEMHDVTKFRFFKDQISASELLWAIKLAPKLEVLEFVNASLFGSFPDSAVLSSLKKITIEDIKSEETIENICKLIKASPNLRVLHIKKCNLSAEVLKAISNLHSLEEFTLEEQESPLPKDTSSIQGVSYTDIFNTICSMKNLKVLELQRIKKAMFDQSGMRFKKMEQLQCMRIDGALASPGATALLGALLQASQNLVTLDVASENGDILLDTRNLKFMHLQNLRVRDTPSLSSRLANCSDNLKSFDISFSVNKTYGADFETMMPRVHLSHVSLDFDLNEFGIKLIETQPSLKSVKIFGVEMFSSAENRKLTARLFTAMKNLESIEITSFRNIPDFFTSLLPKDLEFTQLNRIKLVSAPIQRVDLVALLKRMPNLEEVELDRIGLDTVNSELIHYLNSRSIKILPAQLISEVQLLEKWQREKKKKDLSESHHDPEYFLSYRPQSEFKKGADRSLSQDMIMAKLAIYISLRRPDFDNKIESVATGICHALATLFNETSSADWKKMLESLQKWDGDPSALDFATEGYLKKIFERWKDIYVHNNRKYKPSYTFLGDAFTDFLNHKESRRRLLVFDESFIVSNPWHSIAIKFNQKAQEGRGEWRVYDPNYQGGYKTFPADKTEDVKNAVEASLGKLYAVGMSWLSTKPRMQTPEDIIAKGGLLVLDFVDNFDEIKPLIEGLTVKSILPETLKMGLFIRANISAMPAFMCGIMAEKVEVSTLTFKLLNELYESYKDKGEFRAALMKSMDAVGWNFNLRLSLSEKIRKLNNNILDHRYDTITKILLDCIFTTVKISHEAKPTPVMAPSPVLVPEKPDKSKKPKKAEQKKEPEKKEPERKAPDLTPAKDVREHEFEVLFETMGKRTLQKLTRHDFLTQLLAIPAVTKGIDPDHKRLVETSSSQHVRALSLAVLQHCGKISRPVFYVDSPNDLICSAPYIERTGNKGTIRKAVAGGGRLFDFLQQHQDKANPPIIVVNYENFTNQDKRRFKGLLADARHADGTPLSDFVLLLGIENSSSPLYSVSSEFSSKFSSQQDCPLTLDELSAGLFVIPEATESVSDTNVVTINLFHADDWEERLVGKWVINGESLYFEEGPLVKAIKESKSVRILNGDWDDEKFRFFWDALAATRKLDCAGEVIPISQQFQLYRSDGYLDHHRLKPENIHKEGYLDIAVARTLNPSNVRQFLTREICDDTLKTLNTTQGIIAEYSGMQLHVNVTRDLSEDQWAEILEECKRCSVTLICHYAPAKLKRPFNSELKERTRIIESTDVDATLLRLSNADKSLQFIDCSSCESSALLTLLQGDFDQKTLKFSFTEKESALLKALRENKNVVLVNPSPKLADALAPLLLSRQYDPDSSRGSITIVTGDSSALSGFPAQIDNVSAADKRELLIKRFGQDVADAVDSFVSREPFCKLASRARYFQRVAEVGIPVDTEHAWQGMLSLLGGIKLKPLDLAHAKELADAFVDARQDAIKQGLKFSPFLFLTGLTGVGKSTHIEKYLEKDDYAKLYNGDAAMIAWVTDQSKDKLKVLFIDEANIATQFWNIFEGLFHVPPGILIDNVFYPLDENHKVIFAGNPMSYGGEREFDEFFARHGNALLFDPLPLEFIHEYIIKPILEYKGLQSQIEKISPIFLEVYQFLCECSVDEVLISPREVQMMALLTLSHLEKFPNDDPINTARHYAYLVGQHLAPEKMRAKFEQQFATTVNISHDNPVLSHPKTDYVRTPAHEQAINLINDFLQLQEFRKGNSDLNSAQYYGGLGGIVIEGAAEVGKKKMVIAQLLNRGYTQVKLGDLQVPDKAFYFIPVNMNPDDKITVLLKAFDEGAFVVIDAINSSPMMERLLNDLLMGKAPGGVRPKKPGFGIIGIQKPITVEGTDITSNALARRVVTASLRKNFREENRDILLESHIESDIALPLATALDQVTKKAEREGLAPPTISAALRIARHYKQQLHASEGQSALQVETIITIAEKGETTGLFVTSKTDLLKKMSAKSIAKISPDWQITEVETDDKTIASRVIKKPSGEECLNITKYKMTTHCQDSETMVAVLRCFKTANPKAIPHIISTDTATVDRWKEACKEVYSDKPSIEWNNFITLTTMAKKEAQTFT